MGQNSWKEILTITGCHKNLGKTHHYGYKLHNTATTHTHTNTVTHHHRRVTCTVTHRTAAPWKKMLTQVPTQFLQTEPPGPEQSLLEPLSVC